MTKFNPKSISWWHEQLADWMLLNPDRSLKDSAAAFGVSIQYIYMLKNSDSFKAYWDFRRRQHQQLVSGQQIENLGGLSEKIAAVADMALDQIIEQLETNAKAQDAGVPSIAHDELRSTADMALKKLGYGLPAQGGAAGPANNTQVNITINAKDLELAREKMKQLHGVTPALPAEVPEMPDLLDLAVEEVKE